MSGGYMGGSPLGVILDSYNKAQLDLFLGSQNLIINGAMQVSQRGTSFAGVSSGDYTVDRFQMNGDVGTWTASQDTDAPEGFAYSHKLLLTSGFSIGSLEYWAIQQKIEGQNLQMLKYGTANALSVTLGFWVKSNITGTFCVNLYQSDGNKNYPNTYTINSADTWEFKTITYSGDTATSLDNDTSESLRLVFLAAAGSGLSSGTVGERTSYTDATFAAGHSAQIDATNDYISITGVQLVPGETLPPFLHLPYDEVKRKCMRYYQVYKGMQGVPCWAHNSNIGGFTLWYSVPMRPGVTGSVIGTATNDTSVQGTTEYTTYHGTGYLQTTNLSLSIITINSIRATFNVASGLVADDSFGAYFGSDAGIAVESEL